MLEMAFERNQKMSLSDLFFSGKLRFSENFRPFNLIDVH